MASIGELRELLPVSDNEREHLAATANPRTNIAEYLTVLALVEEGLTPTAIGERMGYAKSRGNQVITWLAQRITIARMRPRGKQ